MDEIERIHYQNMLLIRRLDQAEDDEVKQKENIRMLEEIVQKKDTENAEMRKHNKEMEEKYIKLQEKMKMLDEIKSTLKTVETERKIL